MPASSGRRATRWLLTQGSGARLAAWKARSRSRPRRGTALLTACAWLDSYFADKSLPELPTLHLMGTPFQQRIWQLLLEIPYGQTTTYGALAHEYERRFGSHTSARAVGGAVGRNPISIIVPCHRVLGTGGAITGYAGGVERKRALLALEGVGR